MENGNDDDGEGDSDSSGENSDTSSEQGPYIVHDIMGDDDDNSDSDDSNTEPAPARRRIARCIPSWNYRQILIFKNKSIFPVVGFCIAQITYAHKINYSVAKLCCNTQPSYSYSNVIQMIHIIAYILNSSFNSCTTYLLFYVHVCM